MKAGYVSFCDHNYVTLMQVLIDSLDMFSDLPIELFGINMHENPFKNKNVIFRPIVVDASNFNRICYMKIYASLHTSLDYAAMFDADMIANKNVDDLIDFAQENAKQLPLNAGHGRDPDNQAETMQKMGVSAKSMPYVHATYVFSAESKPFWGEAQRYVDEFTAKGFWPPNADETIINCLLWKHGAKKQMSIYDPFVDVFKEYSEGLGFESGPLAGYYMGKHLTYNVFHGCKDVDKARGILNSLVSMPKNALDEIKPKVVIDGI